MLQPSISSSAYLVTGLGCPPSIPLLFSPIPGAQRGVLGLNADVCYIGFSVQPLFMARLAKLDEQYEHWLAVI